MGQLRIGRHKPDAMDRASGVGKNKSEAMNGASRPRRNKAEAICGQAEERKNERIKQRLWMRQVRTGLSR